MSLGDGKCPTCGGALEIDVSREKATCKYCGNEFSTSAARQKIVIDGIADFDALMLSAERAIKYDDDFDKAERKYREALDLKPDDYRALWGLFLCRLSALDYAYSTRGYEQTPYDCPSKLDRLIESIGKRACDCAPDSVRSYYEKYINSLYGRYDPPKAKKSFFKRLLDKLFGN